MSVAWTTILIIALLLPGVFFFIGFATRERYAREIVKSSAIGDVGWAVLISIIIHLLAWSVLAFFGFNLSGRVNEFADYDRIPHSKLIDYAVGVLWPLGLYIIATAFTGLALGGAISSLVHRGYLPFLVTHKWINEVKRSMKKGLVTAYVMTTTAENNKVLMYKGILAEFYQDRDGKFVYVVLKSCSRYFMTFEEATPKTGKQLQLFGAPGQSDRVWDFLQINGDNIANVLFDPSPQILETTEGKTALNKALKELQKAIDRLPSSQAL